MAEFDLSGRALGDFVLRERIDQGGYGAVYRCEQPLLGRHAVVKVLHQRLRNDEIAMQRFMREAQLASRLDHPYAAHVYAFGIEGDDGLPWIAMELVQGVTLNRWLMSRGPMPLDQFVPFFECVAQVVQVAHECGIVHRDLKPSNVMVIERAGHLFPKLLDFGIAKLRPSGEGPHPWGWPDGSLCETQLPVVLATDAVTTARIRATPRRLGSSPPHADPSTFTSTRRHRITDSDDGIGSPAYMSPEQWSNSFTVGPAADLYALGIVAYEALTGHLPFTAADPEDYYHQHCHAQVPSLGAGFDASLDEVFRRALAKRPEDRYRDALELAAALRTELRAQPREQVKNAAQQWLERGRPASLLWRGEMLRTVQLPTAQVLGEAEASFLAASRRLARRATRNRRLFAVLGVAAALGAVDYRARLESRMAERLVTQAEVEQGRAGLLHDEIGEAVRHLDEAVRRGDRSAATAFMFARALQPRLAEQARLPATKGRMWSAVFSPDGRQIATTDDEAAQIWDARTHQLLHTMRHNDTVYHAVYSADGTRLFTAGGDGLVGVWDTASGALVRTLSHGGKPPRYMLVAASRDGRLVAAIDGPGTLARVWDATTGGLVAELGNDAADYPQLAFSADGRWLASGGGDDVRVFDTRNWTRAATIPGPRIQSLSFDPAGDHLVTGASGGDASIWAIPSGERTRHLREIGESIDAVAFSPDGTLVVTASHDGNEQIWAAASGELQTQGNWLHSKVSSVEFDPTSRLVVSAGASGTVVIADASTGMPVTVLEAPRNVVRVVHFDPSSQHVVGASLDGTARVWDASSPYRRWGAPATADGCGIVTDLEPDGRFIAVGCRDRPTRVWDTAHDRLLAELPPVTHVDSDCATAFPAVSATGDRAAIARGNAVEIYELPGGRLLRRVPHSAPVSAVAFAGTGRDLASGASDGSLQITRDAGEPIVLRPAAGGIEAVGFVPGGRIAATDTARRLLIYDLDHRAVPSSVEIPTRVMALRMSPDGRRLITIPRTGGKAAPPMLWDLERVRAITLLEGHVGRTFSARFVADGSAILTAGGDGTVRRWDGETGAPQQTYRGGSMFLSDATITPDGAMVVAGGGDGAVRFWDAASGNPLWLLPSHKSHVIGVHFEGAALVTRGFSGELTRWTFPDSAAAIEDYDHRRARDTISR